MKIHTLLLLLTSALFVFRLIPQAGEFLSRRLLQVFRVHSHHMLLHLFHCDEGCIAEETGKGRGQVALQVRVQKLESAEVAGALGTCAVQMCCFKKS